MYGIHKYMHTYTCRYSALERDMAGLRERKEEVHTYTHTYIHTYTCRYSALERDMAGLRERKEEVHTYIHTYIHTHADIAHFRGTWLA
jgi:hypothetical protein